MFDRQILTLPSPSNTAIAAAMLLHSIPRDRLRTIVALRGELGAGKTTFVQGLGKALGIKQSMSSPTFALEQRYFDGALPLLHIDLYRLTDPLQADAFIEEALDDWQGLCCIEWPERLSKLPDECIEVFLTDPHRMGRELEVIFGDTPLPSRTEIEQWREECMTPENVVAHCDAVAELCREIATTLRQKGTVVRIEAVAKAGELHDMLRFIDFKNGGKPAHIENPTPQQQERWDQISTQYPEKTHEIAARDFLVSRGYPLLGSIVEKHGFLETKGERTLEEKILFYADKCLKGPQFVSVDERFADFNERYGPSPERDAWYEEVKRIEAELQELGYAV